MVLFIRDQVARPAIGRHDADRFLPFLWTLFFFILFLNLIGLVPWGGSPTGALGVTGGAGGCHFLHRGGGGHGEVRLRGVLDRPGARTWTFPSVCGCSVADDVSFWRSLGLFIRHFILAVRLFANMFAGHLVLAVIVGFIAVTAPTLVWYGVMPTSVVGAVALSLLEVMVALIQAYVFTFLAALFIGMAVHQH